MTFPANFGPGPQWNSLSAADRRLTFGVEYELLFGACDSAGSSLLYPDSAVPDHNAIIKQKDGGSARRKTQKIKPSGLQVTVQLRKQLPIF